MLVHRAVLHLIHSVELSLEQHEFSSTGRILVKEALLEFLEGVHYLEEVCLSQEEFEILKGGLL